MKRILFALALLFNNHLFSNNLTISAVTLTNDSTVSFTISWENSWRVSSAPYNWDAAWIFIKRRDCAANTWYHTNLSTTSSDHTAASPLVVDAVTDGKGVFIRRSADGVGNISSTTISLRMTGVPVGEFDFKVFGIEMVYIPQGAFYLGDGLSTNTFRIGNTTNPYPIVREDTMLVSSNTTTNLGATGGLPPSNIPVAYPKGFASFYCMKYEITHGMYVEFLNSITSSMASTAGTTTRGWTSAANRHNVTGAWPIFATTVPNRATAFLAWGDLLAYLDWTALRPMTEMEYEKVCRGPIYPEAGEYAWGTTNITEANTPANDGAANETCTEIAGAGGGLCNYNVGTINPNGPFRVGFAATATSSRYSSGSSYYGVMEMTGNVWEHVVGTTATGLAFTGNLGDGELSLTPNPGNANVAGWPSQTAATNSATSASGAELKGGSWGDALINLRVSDRTYFNYDDGRRFNTLGGRGVRQF